MFPNLLGQKAYHHLSDADMADLIGVSRTTYLYKMSNGKFTAAECKTYCDHFGKSFDFLFATNEEI